MPIERRLWRNPVPLIFSSLIGANILTMSLANFLELKTSFIPILFLAAFLATALLHINSGVSLPSLTRGQQLFALGFGLLLFLPRSPYLLEGLFGYSMNAACPDDLGHIQELASLVHSDTFPPRSTFDNTKYLSFYYAPWILGTALYWTGLAATVKQALGFTILTYEILFSYYLLYAAKVLFADANLQRNFVALCMLYGGFDFIYWLTGLSMAPSHSEWWATEFGFSLQFSNFFTLCLWVPHHLMSALSILYGVYVLASSKGVSGRVMAGLFFLFGVFSSVFVAMGSLPIVLLILIRNKTIRSVPVTLLSFSLFSLPLWWIYLGNEAIGFKLFGALSAFWMGHRRAAFLVFLLVITLELFPLIGSALSYAARRRDDVWLAAACVLYLLSTFFVAYSGSNNYAMRGSIVPIFTLTYLATPVLHSFVKGAPKRWLWPAIVSYLAGGILEYASFTTAAVRSAVNSNTEFNRAALTSNLSRHGLTNERLVQQSDLYPGGWYLLERPKQYPGRGLADWYLELIKSDNRYRLTLSHILASRGEDNEAHERSH